MRARRKRSRIVLAMALAVAGCTPGDGGPKVPLYSVTPTPGDIPEVKRTEMQPPLRAPD